MGRNAKRYPTHLVRARIRETYREAVRQVLSRDNFFDPTKPAHGDMSSLIERLLQDWLKKKMKPTQFNKLLFMKKGVEVKELDFTPPTA